MMGHLVRLKSYDIQRRYVLQSFAYQGLTFRQGDGWARVSDEIAAYLRTVRVECCRADSPLAFEVATDEEARKVDAQSGDGKNLPATPEGALQLLARDEADNSDTSKTKPGRARKDS